MSRTTARPICVAASACGGCVGPIENAPTHAEIDEWQNRRGTEINTLLWYREEYLVVLAQRQNYWLLKTAYCTEQRGRIEKLRRERDAFRRAAGLK